MKTLRIKDGLGIPTTIKIKPFLGLGRVRIRQEEQENVSIGFYTPTQTRRIIAWLQEAAKEIEANKKPRKRAK